MLPATASIKDHIENDLRTCGIEPRDHHITDILTSTEMNNPFRDLHSRQKYFREKLLLLVSNYYMV